MTELAIATVFSRFPAGRYLTDGPYPGEKFRPMLVEGLRGGASLTVDLDGTIGYGSSFLEEAFGGLVRDEGFSIADLHQRLVLKATDKTLLSEVWGYIDDAVPRKR